MQFFFFKITFLLCLTAVFSLSAQNAPEKTAVPTKVDSVEEFQPFVGSMPVMKFDKKTINFGKIKTGEKSEVVYNFTNVGNKDLDILIVSACECTNLDWTRTTVKPNEKGFIKAIFDSEKVDDEDHQKPLKKTVDITLKQTHPSNDYPLVEELNFEVFIVD